MNEEQDLLQDNEQVEEVVEAVEETVVNAEPIIAPEIVIPEKTSSMSKSAVSIISILVTLIVCAGAFYIYQSTSVNKYNKNELGYSETLDLYAEANKQTLAELIDELKLPADMPGDTLLDVAQYYIPASKMAENYGMSFDELKEAVGLADVEGLTENDVWGKFTNLMKENQKAEAEANADENADAEEATEAPVEATEEAESEAPTEAPAE